ncbi:MAG: S8 family serine peptidase [Pseudomonadota bacterium]
MVELLRTGPADYAANPEAAPFYLPDPDHVGPAYAAEIETILEMQADREGFGGPDVETDIRNEIEDIVTPFMRELADTAGPPGSILKLMNMMDMAGFTIAYHLKRRFGRLRPHVADRRVDPLIDVPTHSAYPSAHAVQTHLIAHAIAEIYEDSALTGQVFETARRISINREIAGVHYASDTEAGILIAQVVFPMVRLVLDPVFTEAVEAMRPERAADCSWLGLPDLGAMEGASIPDGMPWNLAALGLDSIGTQGDTGAPIDGTGQVVAMIDGAVDVTHPALADAIEDRFTNIDYPAPSGDPWPMGSKGIGHGTAMAGLIAGRDGGRRMGVAPGAKLHVARAANLVGDDPMNREDLAVAVLDLALAGDIKQDGFGDPCGRGGTLIAPLAALLLSLDFARPERPPVAGVDGTGSNPREIDPFILAILIAQTQVPVVIAAGNSGASGLAYPAGAGDYEDTVRVLTDPQRQADVLEVLNRLARRLGGRIDQYELQRQLYAFVAEHVAPLKSRIAQSGSSTDYDPFADTGIVVVGAAAPNADGTFRPTAYSQHGPGLCVLAPSASEGPRPMRCGMEGGGTNPVYTADILGPGGFASDPTATVSHEGQRTGFGGTSAAAAQVAGALALIASVDGPATPADRRRRLRDLATGESYSNETGYGALNLESLT